MRTEPWLVWSKIKWFSSWAKLQLCLLFLQFPSLCVLLYDQIRKMKESDAKWSLPIASWSRGSHRHPCGKAGSAPSRVGHMGPLCQPTLTMRGPLLQMARDKWQELLSVEKDASSLFKEAPCCTDTICPVICVRLIFQDIINVSCSQICQQKEKIIEHLLPSPSSWENCQAFVF